MKTKILYIAATALIAAAFSACSSDAAKPETKAAVQAPAVDPAMTKADEAIATAKDAKAKGKALHAKVRLLDQQKQKDAANALRETIFRDASLSSDDRGSAFVPWGQAKHAANKRNKPALTDLLTETEKMLALPDLRGPYIAMVNLYCDVYKTRNLKEDARFEKVLRAAVASPVLGQYHKGVYALRLANLLAAQDKYAEGEKVIRSVAQDPKCRSFADSCYVVGFHADYLCSGGDLDGAIAAIKFLEKKFPKEPNLKSAVANGVAKQYQRFYRKDDAIKVLQNAGCYLAAAKIMRPVDGWKEAERILKDEKMPIGERVGAYGMLIEARSSAYLTDLIQYQKLYTENTKQIGWTGRFGPLWTAMMNGDYTKAAFLVELARTYEKERDKFQLVFWQIRANYALKNSQEAAALAKKYSKFEKFSAKEQLICALLAEMDRNDFPNRIDGVLKQFPVSEKLTAKDRSQALLQAGKVALTANKEEAAVALDAAYQKLFTPEPTKEFVIKFSETPVFGVSDFLAMKDKPAPQLMDRKYGGNMDFLVTDVSTGDRTSNMGSSKMLNYNKFYAFCDENGLHLIFAVSAEDPVAAMSGLDPKGSFEMYLAPGRLQAHNCFLIDVGSSLNHVYSTLYNSPLYYRIREMNPEDIRSEARAGEKCVYQYLFLDWNNYYSCLPENGDEWDFENLHWASFLGGYGWNGTKSIHGHGTWGHLKFELTPAQVAKIRFHVLTRAKKFYTMEKNYISRNGAQTMPGAIKHWEDPVLGDPKFNETMVKPLIDKLDSYLPLVKTDMSDADIAKVYSEAVPGWYNIVYSINELRATYLQDKLSEE